MKDSEPGETGNKMSPMIGKLIALVEVPDSRHRTV